MSGSHFEKYFIYSVGEVLMLDNAWLERLNVCLLYETQVSYVSDTYSRKHVQET